MAHSDATYRRASRLAHALHEPLEVVLAMIGASVAHMGEREIDEVCEEAQAEEHETEEEGEE